MTLTETAALTKKAFAIGVIGLILLIIAWVGFTYYYNTIYLPSLPPKEEKPEMKFGPLPKLPLPQTSGSSSNYSYTLDTDTGEVPKNLPKIIKVYPITPLSTDLLALDRARSLADKLDFKNGPEMISSTEYQFSDKFNGLFAINLDTGNFAYKHIESTASATIKKIDDFPGKETLTANFKSFLSNKGLLKEQLQNGRSNVFFNKTIKSDSDFATLSLWQEDIDKLPIITPTFNTGLIKAVLSKSEDDLYKYQELNYTYWPINYEQSSTYPLLSAAEAFALLKSGEAAIITEPSSPKVSITRVYLGYYLSSDYLPFLQPVYVFEGDQFVGLVSAVSPDQISSLPAPNTK